MAARAALWRLARRRHPMRHRGRPVGKWTAVPFLYAGPLTHSPDDDGGRLPPGAGSTTYAATIHTFGKG